MVTKLIYLRFCNDTAGIVHDTVSVEDVTVQDADSPEQHNHEADHEPEPEPGP